MNFALSPQCISNILTKIDDFRARNHETLDIIITNSHPMQLSSSSMPSFVVDVDAGENMTRVGTEIIRLLQMERREILEEILCLTTSTSLMIEEKTNIREEFQNAPVIRVRLRQTLPCIAVKKNAMQKIVSILQKKYLRQISRS